MLGPNARAYGHGSLHHKPENVKKYPEKYGIWPDSQNPNYLF